MLAVRFYDVMIAVHVLAVVVAFGSSFAFPVMEAAARRGHVGDLPAMHRAQLAVLRMLVTPAMVLVLAAGLFLVTTDDGPYDLGSPWVGPTFAILIVLFGLVGAVFTPGERKLAELADRDLAGGTGQLSPEYDALAHRANIAGPIAGILIAVAVYLMVVKPGGV